jgi:ABC-2 type transport system ATP-binding protein
MKRETRNTRPETDTGTAIKLENLTKVFGKNTAVDGLTLEVHKGELFGLVGPDGAGKTTVMRLLATIMEPTSGKAWVAGHQVLLEGEKIKEKIGYMSQRFGLYEDLTVMENITFYADLFGVPMKERPARTERLLAFSNLGPFKTRLAGQLSGGMKQKLGLACALIHTPEILLLDEPTCGVDPVSRRDFWKILYELLRDGITIFVSTSYLDEAERCTTIGLIHHGRLLVVGEPAAIKASFKNPMLELSCDNPRKAAEALSYVTGVTAVTLYGDRLHVAIDDGIVASHVRSRLTGEGIVLTGERTIGPSLEDIFISRVQTI